MLIDIRSAKITAKGQIAIPQELRKRKGFKQGDRLVIISFKDRVELRPMGAVEKRMETAFTSERALAKDWTTPEEDEAWKDL